MNLRTVGIAWIGSVLLFGLNTCGVTDGLRQSTASQVYLLDLPRKQPVHSTGAGPKPKIIVAAPEAWPGFASVEIAYTRAPNQIQYYAYSEWADTPAQMIGPLLARALEDSGHFDAVVSPGKSVAADLRLDTEIIKIQQEFGVSPSIGRIVLRAQLIDLSTGQVQGTRTFQATAPAPTEDPAGAVAAINDALLIVFDQILAYFETIIAAPIEKKG